MTRALWKNTVIAESDQFLEVEGNVYFPLSTLKMEHFRESAHTSFCPWKGTASYLTIEAAGETNENAAWVYRDPKEKAGHIKDHVAFWKGVVIER